MTALRLARAYERSGRMISRRDDALEVANRATRARALVRTGRTHAEIATLIGVSERVVDRYLSESRATETPEVPKLPDPRRISDTRAAEMEQMVDLAMTLVGELRDGDPVRVWLTLDGLKPRRLMELTVVALAMVPDDRSRDDLLAWVYRLPAAHQDVSD